MDDNTPRFEPAARIGRHPNQLAAEIDGQVVVMGLAQGKYVGLDDIATTVWHRLDSKPTLSELCDGLVRDFAGDPAVIQQDVRDLLGRLHELGLIVVENAGERVE